MCMMENSEQEHLKDLERLRKLRPIDDDFMRVLLKNNVPLAELLVRIIMDKPDLVLLSCETQADMKRVTGARSICLDAYAMDAQGKKYDIEIQRADKGASLHRARYHASVMDVENLDKGQDFSELPDVYVIFVTESDVFKEGRAVYRMGLTDLDTGAVREDGKHILYVNGVYRGNDQIGQLMHDMNCTSASDMVLPLMAERTRYFKENPKGVAEMCAVIEEMRKESFAEGELRAKRATAEKLSKIGMSREKIAGIVDVSLRQVEEWLPESLVMA